MLSLYCISGASTKESIVSVLLLGVERLMLPCACRRDEVLVHQREDAGIDSREFSLQHDGVLPRVSGLLFVGLGPLLLLDHRLVVLPSLRTIDAGPHLLLDLILFFVRHFGASTRLRYHV